MRRYSREEYASMMLRLFPTGLAWNMHPDGILMRLTGGFAGVLARVNGRMADLVETEQFPARTEELFPEWETEYGLPDACRPYPETQEQRRYDLIAKYNERGGQNKAYFIALALSLGIHITIQEFKPFRVGENTIGQPMQDDMWYFVWRVMWRPTRITDFKVGEDTAGTPLRSWTRDSSLECLLLRSGPAEKHVIVAYYDPDLPQREEYLLLRGE